MTPDGGYQSNEAKGLERPTREGAVVENKRKNSHSSNPIPDWNTRRWGWLDAVTADNQLSPIAKVLAQVLVTKFSDYQTGECFPGNAVLVEKLGVKSEDTVQRAFKALAARGWLRRTEGRGRGNKAVVIFLLRADVVKLSSRTARKTAEKSVADAHQDQLSGPVQNVKRAEFGSRKMAADLRFQDAEKAADFGAKGRNSAASRIEPNTNQKKGADAATSKDRPAPHLRAVAYHSSDRIEDWNVWLGKRDYPNLQRLGCLGSDAGGMGFDVPFRRPPSPDDALGNRISHKWAEWAVECKEVRHDR